MSAVYDKTGRAIEVGDILKVFHFVGRYGRHNFMFKQVIGETTLGTPKPGEMPMIYLQVSHLNLKPFDDRDGGYHLAKDGTKMTHYEIVESTGVDCFHERPTTGAA